MTAVISFFQGGSPVIVGDLLISGREPETPGWLPTTGSIENVFPKGSGFVPVGLGQKIAVLNEHFVVAWAGNWIQAMAVLHDIREQQGSWALDPSKTESSIQQIIRTNSASEISLLWLIWDRNQVIQNGFDAIGRAKEKPGFGRILGIGSPSALEDFDSLMDALTNEQTGEHLALSRGLVTAAAFSHRELLDPNVLVNYFGGGYEIVLLAENRLQKLDDFVLVTWDAEEFEGGWRFGPPFYFQRHLYKGDVLLIRGAKLEASGVNEAIYSARTFVAHPASRFISTAEAASLPQINISGKLICNIVRLRKKDGRFEMIFRVSQWVNKPAEMTVEENQHGVQVSFRPEYLKSWIS